MSKTQAVSKSIPEFKNLGLKFPVGADKIGVGVQVKKITQAGATPFSVVFADNDMLDMKNADYVVLIHSEGSGKIDESTITTTGFDVTGGADTDVLHIVVIGEYAGMLGADGNV